MLTNLFKSKNAEQIFWEWFSKHNATYYTDLETDRDNLFAQLSKQLKKIDDTLTFEFSPVLETGKREFIISADGIKKTFPAVQKLVEAAPAIDKWDIIAFRQPHKELTVITLGDFTFDFKDAYFRYARDNDKIGIELNIQGYEDATHWNMAIFIMLDSLIGEYDTEMMLSFIDRKALDKRMIEHLHPITDLPLVIADHKKELFG